MKYFDCKTSETQEGSPTKFSGIVSQKNWRGSWCSPSLFTSTFLNIKNFLKHRRVPLRNVSLLETNIFEAQSWSPDHFFPKHFLRLENYLKHRRVPWRTLLILWNKIVLRRILIPSLFYAWKISMLDFSEARNCSPTKCFSILRQKKLTENRDAHPVSYPEHSSVPKSFWSTIGFLYEKFRYCETSAERKNFSGESWHTSPSYARKISISKTFWNTEGFLYEMFRYWETNNFEAQLWCPHPSFLQHFFHLEIFLNHKRVPWRKLSVLWNKIVLRRILIPLPHLCMKNFWTRFFLKRWRLPYETFRYSETKKF